MYSRPKHTKRPTNRSPRPDRGRRPAPHRSVVEKPNLPKPELLAPAGKMESFYAALEAGADAVYVGSTNFNARMRAQNFSMDDLARMVGHAHSIGRKVYVTVNTLIKEGELAELIDTLDALRHIGPDALIIQDLGVYRLARKLMPEIPLHASTQMTIHSLDGALQAQRMGFERVILARELTLAEIKVIRGACTIELETFVHGALCYSVSGQCLCSSFLHGNSANRGRCMQPCRRLFEPVRGDASHRSGEAPLFSMRDLGAAPILTQLVSAGIHAFKIEGRLKPAETIARIVRAYRILIDACPVLSREAIATARGQLDLAVGREPSTGFYQAAEPSDVQGDDKAAHSGKFMGESLAAPGGRFALAARDVIKAGDRLRVQVSPSQPAQAFVVRSLYVEGRPTKRARGGQRVEIEAPFPVPPGSMIVKAADAEATERGASKRYDRLAAEAMPAQASVRARIVTGDKNKLRLDAMVGLETVSVARPFTWKGEIGRQEGVAILMGDTPSAIRLRIEGGEALPDPIPCPAEDLAAARDALAEKVSAAMDAQRASVLASLDDKEEGPSGRVEVEHLFHLASVDHLARIAASRAAPDDTRKTSFVLDIAESASRDVRDLVNLGGMRGRIVLALPRFMFEVARHAEVQEMLRRALDSGFRRFEVSNLGHFQLLKATNRRNLDIFVAPGIGCLNSQARAQLEEMGAALVTYAMEGDLANLEETLKRVPPERLAVQVFGRVPAFVSRAPWKERARRVRLNQPPETFSVEHRDGLNWVFPTRTFSILDRLDDLQAMGIGRFLHDLTDLREAGTAAKYVQNPAMPECEKNARATFNSDRGLE